MIAIAYEVKRYRELLKEYVASGFVVIEIGPHIGESTKGYLDNASLAVAVDKGLQAENALKRLGEKNKNLVFVRGDARSFETVKKVLQLTGRCDVLAVDLGGGRFPDTVFKVWAIWSGVFKPRHSVIRNRGLAEFIQRAKLEDESLNREFSDNGWMSVWGRKAPSKLKEQLDEFSLWTDNIGVDEKENE